MSYEDLVTMKAFLMALENLTQPLPKDLQTDLSIIAESLPESAYELHDLAERYAPLNQKYLSILQGCPGEGERLKFVASETKAANGGRVDTHLSDVEVLTHQLQRQIHQVSTRLNEAQPIDNSSENTASEHLYVGVEVRSQRTSPVPLLKQFTPEQHLIQELGWTRERAAAIRYRLAAFREDWEAPGMEIYDDL